MIAHVTAKTGPAMGNIRGMQTGDTLILHASARKRIDWPRYQDAVRHATARGAEARWVP